MIILRPKVIDDTDDRMEAHALVVTSATASAAQAPPQRHQISSNRGRRVPERGPAVCAALWPPGDCSADGPHLTVHMSLPSICPRPPGRVSCVQGHLHDRGLGQQRAPVALEAAGRGRHRAGGGLGGARAALRGFGRPCWWLGAGHAWGGPACIGQWAVGTTVRAHGGRRPARRQAQTKGMVRSWGKWSGGRRQRGRTQRPATRTMQLPSSSPPAPLPSPGPKVHGGFLKSFVNIYPRVGEAVAKVWALMCGACSLMGRRADCGLSNSTLCRRGLPARLGQVPAGASSDGGRSRHPRTAPPSPAYPSSSLHTSPRPVRPGYWPGRWRRRRGARVCHGPLAGRRARGARGACAEQQRGGRRRRLDGAPRHAGWRPLGWGAGRRVGDGRSSPQRGSQWMQLNQDPMPPSPPGPHLPTLLAS